MEAVATLITPESAFDLRVEQYDKTLLRFTVKKHGAPDLLENLRRFAFPEEAAIYLYEQGCAQAWEVVRVMIEGAKLESASLLN